MASGSGIKIQNKHFTFPVHAISWSIAWSTPLTCVRAPRLTPPAPRPGQPKVERLGAGSGRSTGEDTEASTHYTAPALFGKHGKHPFRPQGGHRRTLHRIRWATALRRTRRPADERRTLWVCVGMRRIHWLRSQGGMGNAPLGSPREVRDLGLGRAGRPCFRPIAACRSVRMRTE